MSRRIGGTKGSMLIVGVVLMSLGVGLFALSQDALTVGQQGSHTETVTEYRTSTTATYVTKTQIVTVPVTTTAVVNNQITTTVSSQPSTTVTTSYVTSTVAANPSVTTYTTTIQGPVSTLTTIASTTTTTTAAQVVSSPGWTVRLSLRDTGVHVNVFNSEPSKYPWVDVEIGADLNIRNAGLINVESGEGSRVIPLSGVSLGQYLYVWVRAYSNYERLGLPELVYVSANQRVESYQYGWTPYSVFGASFSGVDVYKYALIASGAVLIVFSVRRR